MRPRDRPISDGKDDPAALGGNGIQVAGPGIGQAAVVAGHQRGAGDPRDLIPRIGVEPAGEFTRFDGYFLA